MRWKEKVMKKEKHQIQQTSVVDKLFYNIRVYNWLFIDSKTEQ